MIRGIRSKGVWQVRQSIRKICIHVSTPQSFFGNLYIYIPIQQSTQPGTDNPVILFSYHSKQEQPGHSSDPATPLNTVKPNTPRYHSQLHHTLPVWELPYIPTYLPTYLPNQPCSSLYSSLSPLSGPRCQLPLWLRLQQQQCQPS